MTTACTISGSVPDTLVTSNGFSFSLPEPVKVAASSRPTTSTGTTGSTSQPTTTGTTSSQLPTTDGGASASGNVVLTLENGQPLPSWITFDPQTMTCTVANAPADQLNTNTPLTVVAKVGDMSWKVEIQVNQTAK